MAKNEKMVNFFTKNFGKKNGQNRENGQFFYRKIILNFGKKNGQNRKKVVFFYRKIDPNFGKKNGQNRKNGRFFYRSGKLNKSKMKINKFRAFS